MMYSFIYFTRFWFLTTHYFIQFIIIIFPLLFYKLKILFLDHKIDKKELNRRIQTIKKLHTYL